MCFYSNLIQHFRFIRINRHSEPIQWLKPTIFYGKQWWWRIVAWLRLQLLVVVLLVIIIIIIIVVIISLILTSEFVWPRWHAQLLCFLCFIIALWTRNWCIFLVFESLTPNMRIAIASFTTQTWILAHLVAWLAFVAFGFDNLTLEKKNNKLSTRIKRKCQNHKWY